MLYVDHCAAKLKCPYMYFKIKIRPCPMVESNYATHIFQLIFNMSHIYPFFIPCPTPSLIWNTLHTFQCHISTTDSLISLHCSPGGDQGLLNLYFSDWATKDIARHLPFVYNVVSQAFYSYLPAFKQ